MNIWYDVSPKRINPSDFIAMTEISKDSEKKYKLDKKTGLIILDRILYTSIHYPASCGFIPETYGDDHDPLDVLVLCSGPLELRALMRYFPIGVISILGGGHSNGKIIAIPFNNPTYNQYQDINEPSAHIFDEMSHFSRIYRELGNKKTAVREVSGCEEAARIIEAALDSYTENFYR